MTTPPYSTISFAHALAAQERDIKLAALLSLDVYLKQAKAHVEENSFWPSVHEFHEASDGLDTPSYDGIVSMFLPPKYLSAVERLGFRVIEGGGPKEQG